MSNEDFVNTISPSDAHPSAQGEVNIWPFATFGKGYGMEEFPDTSTLTPRKPEGGALILGHSESGNHHTVPMGDVQVWEHPTNPLQALMRVNKETLFKQVDRGPNTHKTHKILPGDYIVGIGRESTPEGFRRVQD